MKKKSLVLGWAVLLTAAFIFTACEGPVGPAGADGAGGAAGTAGSPGTPGTPGSPGTPSSIPGPEGRTILTGSQTPDLVQSLVNDGIPLYIFGLTIENGTLPQVNFTGADLAIAGDFETDGGIDVIFDSALVVFGGEATFGKEATFGGPAEFVGEATFDDVVSFTGAATFFDDATFGAAATFSDAATFTGATSFDDVTFGGATSGNFAFTGTLAGTGAITGTITFNSNGYTASSLAAGGFAAAIALLDIDIAALTDTSKNLAGTFGTGTGAGSLTITSTSAEAVQDTADGTTNSTITVSPGTTIVAGTGATAVAGTDSASVAIADFTLSIESGDELSVTDSAYTGSTAKAAAVTFAGVKLENGGVTTSTITVVVGVKTERN